MPTPWRFTPILLLLRRRLRGMDSHTVCPACRICGRTHVTSYLPPDSRRSPSDAGIAPMPPLAVIQHRCTVRTIRMISKLVDSVTGFALRQRSRHGFVTGLGGTGLAVGAARAGFDIPTPKGTSGCMGPTCSAVTWRVSGLCRWTYSDCTWGGHPCAKKNW